MIVLVSDNGASGEGGPNGSVNENKIFNGLPDRSRRRCRSSTISAARARTTTTRTGWAWAFNTPFKIWKRYSNWEGGTADPMIVSWPKRISKTGARRQYAHADRHRPDDLRVPRDRAARGRQGVHAAPDRRDQLRGRRSTIRSAKTGKQTQFYSMGGTRAIWHQGWKAAAVSPAAPDMLGRLRDPALGALRHRERPERVPRSRRRAAREAAGADRALVGRGRPIRRACRSRTASVVEILGHRAAAAREAARPATSTTRAAPRSPSRWRRTSATARTRSRSR